MVEGPQGEIASRGRRLGYVRFALIAVFFSVPALGGVLTLLQVLRDGQGGIEGLRGTAGVAVSAAGDRVYAVGRHDDALTVFRRIRSNGVLQFIEVHRDDQRGVVGLLGASGVAASFDGRHVYVTAELDDSLAVFSRDATIDGLAFVAVELKSDGVGGVEGLRGASSVAVSPDDELLYVTANVDDALVVFSRDATSDRLTFVEAELNGLNGTVGLDGAVDAAVSPDNRHVYVAAEADDAIAVFRRVGHQVEWVTQVRDGVNGVDGLAGASGVAVSPDGRHVYATGRIDDSVTLFDRDAATGGLRFRALYRDGIDGLRGAADVAVVFAGTRVLVAGGDDDAVAIFRRNANGTLSFFGRLEDGVDGIDGLAGVRALAASDAGENTNTENAYAAGYDDDTLVGFHLARCVGRVASGDTDGDAFCDDVDLCHGDDLTGDLDGDGLCGNFDCNDMDASNLCAPIFDSGFESGDWSTWTKIVGAE